MKKFIMAVFFFSPVLAFGQDMNAMLEKMQSMQSCMESIDQGELEALEQRGTQLQSKIKSLCSQGKSSEAKSQAMAYAHDVRVSGVLKQVQKCTAPLADLIPLPDYQELEKDYTNIDICAQ